MQIAKEQLLIYKNAPEAVIQRLRGVQVSLLHHRAVFSAPDIRAIVEEVLTVEGLELNDFKARLLKRAYLPKSSRALLVFPQEAQVQLEKAPDRNKTDLRLSFFLPPGSYATLVLKALAAE